MMMSKYKFSRTIAVVGMLAFTVCMSCTKEASTSYSIDEQQYLLFDNLDKKGAPIIIGNTFFTKDGNQTKIRLFYFNEREFVSSRPVSLFENDFIEGGNKVMDLASITSQRAGYSETLLDVPYEEAIKKKYHLRINKASDNDTIVGATDLGIRGFKGQDYNLNYSLTAFGGHIERGTMIMWQRRDESFYVNVSMDTLITGSKYTVDFYTGDTSDNGKKWLALGEITNTKNIKYKVTNVAKTVDGIPLSFLLLKNSEIHIEVRKMPENIVVAKAVAGKYKL